MRLKAPYPWFGGKSGVALRVWQRIGDVSNAIEPFAGSLAWLLSRPHPPRIETANDYDAMVSNFWRATQRDPEAVVEWCDWPVSEPDLHARHRWLVYSDAALDFRQRMRTDPEHYDAKVAGWWVWGLCQWIGSGWCDAGADWNQMPEISPQRGGGNGVLAHGSVPQLRGDSGAAGSGIHASGAKRVKLTGGSTSDNRTHNGTGVHADVPEKRPRAHTESSSGEGYLPGVHGRPQLADAYDIGRGVHASPRGLWDGKRPRIHGGEGADPPGVHSAMLSHGTCAERRAWLLDWFGRLRDRLRNVRICCGDWERVCGSPSTTTRLGTTGLFLDPPYAHDCERMHQWAAHLRGEAEAPAERKRKGTNRSADLYATDDGDMDHLVARVLNYCLERGTDPEMRIALAGYEGEHDVLEQHGWTALAWKTNGGYANRRGGGANENAARERIWFSPHCLPEVPEDSLIGQRSLFAEPA